METEIVKLNYFNFNFKNSKKVFKGETTKTLDKFGFYIIKDEDLNSIEIGSPIEKNFFKNKMKINLDFNNFYFAIYTENDIQSLNNNLKLYWIYVPSQERIEFLLQIRTKIFNIFDNLNFNEFLEIRRPVKYSIKKLLYSKISEIDIFFTDKIIINEILKLSEDLVNHFISYKNEFNKSLEENIPTTIKYFENKIKSSIKDIEIFEIKYICYFKEIIKSITKIIKDEYFSKNYQQLYKKEIFNYEENATDIYYKNKENWKLENDSQSLKIKNSECNLIYDYNKDSLLFIFNIENSNSNNINNFEIESNNLEINISINYVYSIKVNENITSICEIIEYMKEGFGIEKINNKNFIQEIPYNHFIGYFKNNSFYGKGIIESENCFYIGEFKENKKDGSGTIFIKKDNEIFQGNIIENVIEGNGKYFYSNIECEYYQGEFKDNNAEGFGKLNYINGDILQSQFKHNIKINEGIYTNKNKQKILIKYNKEGNTEKEILFS